MAEEKKSNYLETMKAALAKKNAASQPGSESTTSKNTKQSKSNKVFVNKPQKKVTGRGR